MSYITDKFNKGDVKFREDVVGWYFEETDEFRPLMSDATMELFLAGLIDDVVVSKTEAAREAYAEETLSNYIQNHSFDDYTTEDIYEMKAAFGDDADVTNFLTGETIHLEDY
jgi:hypothetical protein